KSQLACAIKTGSATSPEAKELATLHASWLQIHWPDGMYSPETHRGLVDGYLMDERFKKYYEAVAPGATQFLRDAVHANI
ncbi:MAG: TipAS antibiotic-recognition domain-containing protein, partial [Anaerotardibacter sp.]